MPELEQRIAEWRRRMQVAGIRTPGSLEELESHLREDIRSLMSAGESEARAFDAASSRMGDPKSLGREFNKVAGTRCGAVMIVSWLWAGLMLLMTVLMVWNLLVGKSSVLLLTHVWAMTAGYGAAFVAGVFGIYYIGCRWFGALLPVRQQSLARAAFWFSHLSAALVVAGLVLGMFWSSWHLGRSWAWDPREIGALLVSVWFIALSAAQRFGRVSERTTMLMCISGNVLVGLAWFGAGIMVHDPGMHALGSYWPLAVFLGVHFFFLVRGMALAPAAMVES